MQNPALANSPRSALTAPDKTVLLYGAIAALTGLALHQLTAHRLWPWGHPFALYFLLQWLAMAPLAGAMLAGMASGRRWVAALLVYGLILPALTAYGLTSTYGTLPNEHGGWLDGGDLSLALMMTGAAGFILLPVIQALDASQPQWNYPAVFRAAWCNTVHLALALCLATAVCLLFKAAGAMFSMIGIKLVAWVVDHAVFRYATWPLILAASLVGVRRRPQLADTLQRSWLTLNAWLLPLVTLVGLAFTIALAARMALGLQAVQLSAGALIAFSLVWIKFINAAWQDNPDAVPFGPTLRRALQAGMLCLLPLAAVALYGAVVRVDQYGWTVMRAWGVATSALLVLYGVGYGWAALRPKCYYAVLGATNLITAGATLAVLAAFITPLANPLRLTAESQLQRLLDGRQDPEDFNYYAMRNDYGHWGEDGLRQLADGAANAQDPRIALAAAESLKGGYFNWSKTASARDAAKEKPPALATTPIGTEVPAAWWAYLRHESPQRASTCSADVKSGEQDGDQGSVQASNPATSGTASEPRCQLIFADLTGDGKDEIILYIAPAGDIDTSTWERMFAYESPEPGQWRLLGSLVEVSFSMDSNDATNVTDIRQALKQGLVRTQPRPDRDLVIGDNLLRLQ